MNNTPKSGLKHAYRQYRCTACGNKQNISTNHTGSCLDYCKNCSWKGVGFGPGSYLFGALHRKFEWDCDDCEWDCDKYSQ